MSKNNQPRSGTITGVTRRKLIACFGDVGLGITVSWTGDLDEIDFLSRIYDLNTLPSEDSRYSDADGDIRQHRLANDDWDDDWVFHDQRFLPAGKDELLLRFLAESLHPEVRSDVAEVKRLAQELNGHLQRDGWELHERDQISGYPVFGWRRCDVADSPTGFPLNLQAVLGSLAELMKHRGLVRELAVLAASNQVIEETSYDNWDGGQTGWSLNLAVDPTLYARLSDEERNASEAALLEAGNEFFRSCAGHHLEAVVISPHAERNPNWRVSANAWLSGEGITNQGRVRSDNIASLECDGLLFRSEPEIHLYKALKRLGVTFAPLPVFLRGGDDYHRLELDFVVLKDGRVLVVEVDGDTFHKETPVEAHERIVPLHHEGAHIERVKASACATPEKARACAQELLKILDRVSSRR